MFSYRSHHLAGSHHRYGHSTQTWCPSSPDIGEGATTLLTCCQVLSLVFVWTFSSNSFIIQIHKFNRTDQFPIFSLTEPWSYGRVQAAAEINFSLAADSQCIRTLGLLSGHGLAWLLPGFVGTRDFWSLCFENHNLPDVAGTCLLWAFRAWWAYLDESDLPWTNLNQWKIQVSHQTHRSPSFEKPWGKPGESE